MSCLFISSIELDLLIWFHSPFASKLCMFNLRVENGFKTFVGWKYVSESALFSFVSVWFCFVFRLFLQEYTLIYIKARWNMEAINIGESRDAYNIGHTQHQRKTREAKTQHRKLKLKGWAAQTPQKTAVKPSSRDGQIM